ncbi:conserved Plasmodium protein, unknown function [Plasmodium sp. gorilla clade G2]|uniref:conserved Plasmodium protein, unknown function n=1 Tax=Plasmodium sp. gorilla clade G2 TaxID=880535 RepID=UPI000D225BE4|nr:conserved Plasmodium protein, unknown function [Plasmodium sp. gorilla clade G2]SOV10922.1 conserved Plasmodium protein, unknown function [Plasmodium sp. gorilla clade G2]
MTCVYSLFFFFICILLNKHWILLNRAENIFSNTELNISRISSSNNFLELSLNALKPNNNIYDDIKKKISNIDVNNIHDEVVKILKFEKLKSIIDIKTSILNCLSESILHMLRSLPAIVEEVTTYNEFCSSLEKMFSFLNDIDDEYKIKIQKCRGVTTDKIIENYFFFHLNDITTIVNIYKNKPNIMFLRFNEITHCLEEFYQKITNPFDEHVKHTELFKNFMKTYKKPHKSNYIDYLKAFLDNFNQNIEKDKILFFFDELYYYYSVNHTYIACFYLF